MLTKMINIDIYLSLLAMFFIKHRLRLHVRFKLLDLKLMIFQF